MSRANNASLSEYVEPPETDDLPDNLRDEDISLPENWVVDGPVATKAQSRAYFVIGHFEKKHGHTFSRGYVIFQPEPDADWEVKSASTQLSASHRVDYGGLTFGEAVETTVERATELNNEMLSVEFISSVENPDK